MEYKCSKCGAEFDVDAMHLIMCPECGAHDWDCMPLWKYRMQQKIEDAANQTEMVEVPMEN